MSDPTVWPAETENPPQTAPTDASLPVDLSGIIGYCADQLMKETPKNLVSSSTVHQNIKDAQKYIFGSDLGILMQQSLTDFTKVCYSHLTLVNFC